MHCLLKYIYCVIYSLQNIFSNVLDAYIRTCEKHLYAVTGKHLTVLQTHEKVTRLTAAHFFIEIGMLAFKHRKCIQFVFIYGYREKLLIPLLCSYNVKLLGCFWISGRLQLRSWRVNYCICNLSPPHRLFATKK